MDQHITTSDYLEALRIIRSFLECGCNEMEITALAILEGKSFIYLALYYSYLKWFFFPRRSIKTYWDNWNQRGINQCWGWHRW